MPIINWMYGVEHTKSSDVADYKNLARERMDEAANLQLSVNKRSINLNLRNFRFQCTLSDILLPHDNILDMEPGGADIIADGFWIFFRPKVNNLILETYGSCQMGVTRISGKYLLTSSKEGNRL